MQHAAVVLGREDSSEGRRAGTGYVLCTRVSAVQEQQPGVLEVGKCGEKLEEGAVLCGKSVKLRSNELICTKRGPQDLEALLVCRQASVADPDWHVVRRRVGRQGKPGRANPCCIPNTSFGGIELDVRVGKQVVLKPLQQECGATGLTGEVGVVEECTHALVGEEVGLHGTQVGRYTEREEGRHERITLLAAFSLYRTLWGLLAESAHTNSDGEP